MKILRKLLLTLVIFSLVFVSIASCGADVDEAEVIASAESLIKKADIIEDIIYGKGITPSHSGMGAYKEADVTHIKEYESLLGEKFETVEDLQTIVIKTYTSGFASDILSGVLSGDLERGTRYYQEKETVMVYEVYKVMKTDEIEYHYDTLKLKETRGSKTVVVSLDVTITNSEEKTQKRNVEITLKNESGAWKLDAPAYAVYSDKYQDYNDLLEEMRK